MDIIDRHFAAEKPYDVQGTLDTYAEDIVWDDVTHPDAPFHGKDEVGRVYSSIIDAIPDVTLTSVKRFSGEGGGLVVDESTLTGHVHGEWSGMEGAGLPWRSGFFISSSCGRADLLRERLVRRLRSPASDNSFQG